MVDGDGVKTFTQEEVNRIVEERLARDRQGRSPTPDTQLKLEALAAQVAEEKQARLNAEAKNFTQTVEATKSRIATELHLPSTLIAFLQGTDELQIRQSAETLLNSLNPGPSIGGKTNPPGGNAVPHTYTKTDFDKMTPDQINKDWENIQGQLKTGSIK